LNKEKKKNSFVRTKTVLGIYGIRGQDSTTTYPGSRSHAASWYDGTYLWLFGGYGYGANLTSFGEFLLKRGKR
jgi:hypothetical protein